MIDDVKCNTLKSIFQRDSTNTWLSGTSADLSDLSPVSEKYDIFDFWMGISENYQGQDVHVSMRQLQFPAKITYIPFLDCYDNSIYT